MIKSFKKAYINSKKLFQKRSIVIDPRDNYPLSPVGLKAMGKVYFRKVEKQYLKLKGSKKARKG